jgi:hypothetical protein
MSWMLLASTKPYRAASLGEFAMIFDSSEMIVLHEKYQDFANYEIPDVVFLDRHDGYEGERQQLENLFASVSSQKQKDWLGRLVNESAQQHIGAWFEIMLYGWLREHFTVQVEPELLGNYPDFVLAYQDNLIIIEAKAFLVAPEERERQRKINRIWSSISGIEKSFHVRLGIKQLGENIDAVDIISAVNRWLDSAAGQEFEYRDLLGNILQLSATFIPTLKKIGVSRSEGLWVNSDVLKAPLSEKAGQHKALRKAGYPYIIAIFLEPSHLSAEEVFEAWIGKVSIVVDMNTHEVVEEKFDRSGIHSYRQEIRHKSVTGTLVFKQDYDPKQKSRYLQSWYVQNPYANVAINPSIFPVESRFVVIEQNDEFFEMKWVK